MLLFPSAVIFSLLLASSSAFSITDFFPDTPVADIPSAALVDAAVKQLSAGESANALQLFDLAISKDPNNVEALFKRGSTQVSLGRLKQARNDFDRVLDQKPDFEAALVHRANIYTQFGNWNLALKDFEAAKKTTSSPERKTYEEAIKAAKRADQAEKKSEWEECVKASSDAISLASSSLDLWRQKTKCLMALDDWENALYGMKILLSRDPSPELFAKASVLSFYGLGSKPDGISLIRKCMQSDPDSKPCLKVLKSERAIQKAIGQTDDLIAKQSHLLAADAIAQPSEDNEEPSLIDNVEAAISEHITSGMLPQSSLKKSRLLEQLYSIACEGYTESLTYSKSERFCSRMAEFNPRNLHVLLNQIRTLMSKKDYEAVLRIIQENPEIHSHPRVKTTFQRAQQRMRVAKQKDYYDVLGVSRTATDDEIKKAHRKMLLKHHPDKVDESKREDASVKMAAVNEAYEVLSNPELKSQYDNGHDPNDPTGGQSGRFGQGNNPFGQPNNMFPPFFQFAGQGQGGQFRFFSGSGGGGGQGPKPKIRFQAPNGFKFS